MGVTINRHVILRAVVTDMLRQELTQELEDALQEVEERLQQIDFQTKPYLTELQRTNLQQAIQVRKQIDAEKQKHEDLKQALQGRREQVANLQNGEEIVRGTLEGSVEVNEGDDLSQLLYGTELLIRDDQVVEIRQRPVTAHERQLAASAAAPNAGGQPAPRPSIITDLSGGGGH